MFITPVEVINPHFVRFVVSSFVVMHISVRAHIGHTSVANFYIGPVKKFMEFVMWRKMLI